MIPVYKIQHYFFLQGLPGVDGREGIPAMPGAKVLKVKLIYLF